jgi:hypothetical protein
MQVRSLNRRAAIVMLIHILGLELFAAESARKSVNDVVQTMKLDVDLVSLNVVVTKVGQLHPWKRRTSKFTRIALNSSSASSAMTRCQAAGDWESGPVRTRQGARRPEGKQRAYERTTPSSIK